MPEPGMLMAVAITTFSDVLGMSPWLGTLHRAVRMRGVTTHRSSALHKGLRQWEEYHSVSLR